MQEIIQNADDAGATKVHFYLDNRQHRTESVIHPELVSFQGPSLMAYNDAVFTDKDWQSIQDMQQSVKAENPFKVGKFGIGFNSIYHITGILLHTFSAINSTTLLYFCLIPCVHNDISNQWRRKMDFSRGALNY